MSSRKTKSRLAGFLLAACIAAAGCQGILSRSVTDVASPGLLGTRYARVSMSRLETGNPALDEIDDFITALNVDVNLPVSKRFDVKGFLGNREASGASVDPFYGPYQMTVSGQHFGVGLTGHARPDDELDPYILVAGQYLVADVTYLDSLGGFSGDEEEFGWVAVGGIEWRPHGPVVVAPYIKHFDNGVFGDGTKLGGRIDTWLDRTWFLEVSGEVPISASGHAIGLGLGFQF